MMAGLDEKTLLAAEQLLKRPLREDEQLEIYRIADIFNMRDVQSFLYLILVFKSHEDSMKKNFAELAALERKIQDTLESSIERILGEGAARIGADMGKAVAEGARETLTSVGEYQTARGRAVLCCFLSLTSVLAYWMGANGFLNAVPPGGAFEAFMFLPAGWSVFFCGAAYTFLWSADHWGQLRRTALYKTLFGLQVVLLLFLGLNLL